MPISDIRENCQADGWVQGHGTNQPAATTSHEQRCPNSSGTGASVGDEAPLAAVRGNESGCVVEISKQSCTLDRPQGRRVPRHS